MIYRAEYDEYVRVGRNLPVDLGHKTSNQYVHNWSGQHHLQRSADLGLDVGRDRDFCGIVVVFVWKQLDERIKLLPRRWITYVVNSTRPTFRTRAMVVNWLEP